MNIGDIIGRKVMILLHSAKGLQAIGIDESSKYCTVVGHDQIGLWVENPSYEETPIRDASGNLIPPSERTPQHYVAHILIDGGARSPSASCPPARSRSRARKSDRSGRISEPLS